MPTAGDVPEMRLIHKDIPSPINPLDGKGVGDGRRTPAAISNPVCDALAPFGAELDGLEGGGIAGVNLLDNVRRRRANITKPPVPTYVGRVVYCYNRKIYYITFIPTGSPISAGATCG